MPQTNKDQQVRAIMNQAYKDLANQAGHLIGSLSESKEAVLAEIRFQRDLVELCQVALS